MELVTTEREGICIVRLVGDFEPTDAKPFDIAVVRAVSSGRVRVVVDAELVKLVCSTALGAFLQGDERLRAAGGELACAALPHFAAELFTRIGLDRRIRCFASVDDALRALSAAT